MPMYAHPRPIENGAGDIGTATEAPARTARVVSRLMWNMAERSFR